MDIQRYISLNGRELLYILYRVKKTHFYKDKTFLYTNNETNINYTETISLIFILV